MARIQEKGVLAVYAAVIFAASNAYAGQIVRNERRVYVQDNGAITETTFHRVRIEEEHEVEKISGVRFTVDGNRESIEMKKSECEYETQTGKIESAAGVVVLEPMDGENEGNGVRS